MTSSRAVAFSLWATASSRSRKTSSASSVGAFARNRSLEPGTAWHVRRGRCMESSPDLGACLAQAGALFLTIDDTLDQLQILLHTRGFGAALQKSHPPVARL